jgi:hypothetical protein
VSRPVRAFFTHDEVVLRRCCKGDLRGVPGAERKTLKGNCLRLQVSVHREVHGGTVDVVAARDPRRDGVAATTAAKVWSLRPVAGLCGACVDEPLPEDESHALVALVSVGHPPDGDLDVIQNQMRDHLAQVFEIRKHPTR